MSVVQSARDIFKKIIKISDLQVHQFKKKSIICKRVHIYYCWYVYIFEVLVENIQ